MSQDLIFQIADALEREGKQTLGLSDQIPPAGAKSDPRDHLGPATLAQSARGARERPQLRRTAKTAPPLRQPSRR